MAKTDIKELSIQVGLNGLSFCILNRTENKVVFLDHVAFEKNLMPNTLLEHLKAYMEENSNMSDKFSSVSIIHQNALSSLIPSALHDENLNADYLKFCLLYTSPSPRDS